MASALDLPKTSLVLPCAGLRFRGSSLVPHCCDEMGQICTNRAMQCMEQGGGVSEKNGDFGLLDFEPLNCWCFFFWGGALVRRKSTPSKMR